MDESPALHVVGPSGSGRETIARAVAHLDPILHDSIEEFHRRVGEGPCTVVLDVDGGVDCHAFLRLCDEVADQDRPWTLLVPESGRGNPLAFRPVSSGFPLECSELESVLGDGENGGTVFDLHEVLRLVARIRHDINNPLTAGLAETQLLLMDVGREGEAGESLTTIERQLQRIQRLVQQLTRLRRPAPRES